jgi:hypothetical protein
VTVGDAEGLSYYGERSLARLINVAEPAVAAAREEKTARALRDALELGAYSAEYITNLLEQRARTRPEPGALHVTRGADLLEIELPPADLSIYDQKESHENP